MPFTTVPDVSQGDVLTETYLDTYVRANGNFLGNPPACSVFHTSNQSVSNATETTLTFGSEQLDTDGMHSTTTNPERITIQTAGLYLCGFSFMWDNNSSGNYRLGLIRLNGSASTTNMVRDQRHVGSGWNMSCTSSGLITLSQGDYLECRADQNSGGSLNVLPATSATANLGYCHFWAFYMGTG